MAKFIDFLRVLNLLIKNLRVCIILVFFAQKDMCLLDEAASFARAMYFRYLAGTFYASVISFVLDVGIQTSYVHGFLACNQKCTMKKHMHFTCIFSKTECISKI